MSAKEDRFFACFMKRSREANEKNRKPVILDGVLFESVHAVARHLKLDPTHVSYRIRAKGTLKDGRPIRFATSQN